MAVRSVSVRCLNRATSTSFSSTFIRLTPAASRQTLPADFLLPKIPTSNYRHFSESRSHSRNVTRTFSHSARLRSTDTAQTRTLRNPQYDEETNSEMSIQVTPRAAKRLSEIMAKDQNPHLALRIQVESGGCHGFQYLMSLVTLPTEILQAKSENSEFDESTIFSTPSPTGGGNTYVIMDGPSLDLLKGSKVDFTQELIGSQFKIVDNPLATSSCGCGTSFDIKV